MTTKSFTGIQVKDADKGEFSAVFSTFNVVDHDGDVTLPGAFDPGTPVRISAYGHASWGGALPVGKGVVRANDEQAWVEGQFFLDTTHGRDTFLTVKAMGELQEWSYSVEPTKNSFGEFDGRNVQFLEKLKGPHEVSPVLAGAGIGTRTLGVKTGPAAPATKRAIPTHDTPVVSRAWDGPAVVSSIPSDARPSELRTVFAWVDPDGDPEAKSSYKFSHHHGVDGAANIRACLAGIAVLNGARGGAGLPEPDRKGVYAHLAAHLRDADREPPELRSQPAGELKFNDELLAGLAEVSGLIDSAARVVALRAEKGKTLSKVNSELLAWISDDLTRVQALLTPPTGAVSDDDLSSVVLASLARIHNL
jgi:hypothetical protein